MFSVKQGQDSEIVLVMVDDFLVLVLFNNMLGHVHSREQFVQSSF